jgi:hypothetical protein
MRTRVEGKSQRLQVSRLSGLSTFAMPYKYKPPYEFSTHLGAACARQFRMQAVVIEGD